LTPSQVGLTRTSAREGIGLKTNNTPRSPALDPGLLVTGGKFEYM
jgi:hypothetical protein